jgi:hypothetical protein
MCRNVSPCSFMWAALTLVLCTETRALDGAEAALDTYCHVQHLDGLETASSAEASSAIDDDRSLAGSNDHT